MQSLEDVLFVDVFNYVNQDNLGISVIGAVEEPGFYDLEKYKYLDDLIEDLNFVGVYPWLATLEQFDEDNLVIVFKNSQNFSQKFNFDDPKKIIDFLKRWKTESMKFKEFDI